MKILSNLVNNDIKDDESSKKKAFDDYEQNKFSKILKKILPVGK